MSESRLADEAKAVVRIYVNEVFNGRNPAVLDQIMAPDYVDHVALHERRSGREAFKQTLAKLQAAFPDGQLTAEDIIAEGDKVVWRWTHRGTHRGEYLGIPPSGRSVVWTGIIIWRIADGRILEWWAVPDTLGLLQQLGAILPAIPRPTGLDS